MDLDKLVNGCLTWFVILGLILAGIIFIVAKAGEDERHQSVESLVSQLADCPSDP